MSALSHPELAVRGARLREIEHLLRRYCRAEINVLPVDVLDDLNVARTQSAMSFLMDQVPVGIWDAMDERRRDVPSAGAMS